MPQEGHQLIFRYRRNFRPAIERIVQLGHAGNIYFMAEDNGFEPIEAFGPLISIETRNRRPGWCEYRHRLASIVTTLLLSSSLYFVTFPIASRRSSSLTMSYRVNIESVFQPPTRYDIVNEEDLRD